jgi:hypothetical protein
MGLIVVAVGIWTGWQAIESFHTGKHVPVSNSMSVEGWEAAGVAVLTVFFGLCFMAVGFGWMKPRGPH